MRNDKLLGIIICLLLLTSIKSLAQETVEINANDRKFIGNKLEYFADSSNQLDINKVISKPFEQCKTAILNLGNTSSSVWLRFAVNSETEKEVYLEVQAPLLDELELYEVAGSTPHQIFKGGMNRPFNNRPIHSQNWLFDLDLNNASTHTYYIKASSGFPLQLPVSVASKNKYVEYSQALNIFWGLYIGIILFAFIYNFFIYLSVRERRYLYYILYILGSVVFYMGLEGFSFKFLWPDIPYLNYLLPSFICITNIIIVLFGINFLHITKEQKWTLYIGNGIIVGFLVIAILNIAGSLGPAAGLAQMLSLITCIYLIAIAVRSYKRKVPTAKYFLIAWTLFLTFVFIYILAINNVIPSNFFTTHCIFIGHTTEVCLLSFALADRINWLKSENEKKQKEIIQQLKINEQIQVERSRLIEQQKVQLEKEVAERTSELRQSLDELKVTQKQLIQKEKMASLGELTAGIAHEIQNPLNFVNNFSELNKELIAELKQAVQKGDLEEVIAIGSTIEDNEQKIIYHGKRADSIVKGMLQHSQTSTGKKELTDINAMVDASVRLSYHGVRDKDKTFNATIKENLAEDVGKIAIVQQDIRRVLLNLLNNAFYAVKPTASAKEKQYDPTVWVSTKKSNGCVYITVKDNGIGISTTVIDKIFQPFFTTKPTGQGTGLGLSLSYDIIKAHDGEIKVESKEGEGSEFTISLPLKT